MATATAEPLWWTDLRALADSGGTAEVTVLGESADDDMGPVHRATILRADHVGLIIERPGKLRVGPGPKAGSRLRLVFLRRQRRWRGVATVKRLARFRLNEWAVVPALVLAGPTDVRSAQRRDFFRASTAGLKLGPACFAALAERGRPGPLWPRDNVRFAGQIVNIGGGGVGVITPRVAGQELDPGRLYRCTIILPDEPEPIEVRAQLVQLRPHGGASLYLGFRFCPAGEAQRRALADRICRFTTRQQLDQLRRRH